MGRNVDTGWYDNYLRGKALAEKQGSGSASDPEIAGLLGIKPKTWARINAAGRFMDQITPAIARERILCGYAPVERLAKLWSIAPDIARQQLDEILSNRVKVKDLENLIREHSHPEPESTSRKRPRAATGLSLLSRLETYFGSSKLVPFDAYRGRALRRKGALGAPNGYYLYDAKHELTCLVLGIKSSGWRDPAAIARELYEHALAQRHVAPAIWLVFEHDNAVLQRLAELSLYWGGSPYDENGQWIFLAYFSEGGHLQVLFEEHFAQLIRRVKQGHGLIGKDELFYSLQEVDGQSVVDAMPVRPLNDLPEPNKTRNYREIISERMEKIARAPGSTNEERGDGLADGLGL